MATYKWVAHKLVEDIRANNDISIPACNELLQSRYGISMKKSNAYIMKAYALSLIHGGHDISYSYLPSYCEVVKETNLGSVAHCAWREEHITIENGNGEPERPLVFKYIFISFAATLNGFLGGCRGLIGVDGTHLKGNYGGVLLTAIALDGNNEIFPIAHAVVESETKDTWTFFLWHLKDLLKQSDRTDWTIISDRQKGILPAVEQVWPEVRKRICVRHLCKNFKKEYPGPLMHGLFWKLANSYSEFTFKKAIEQMERHAGLGAVYWIKEVGDHDLWARYKIEPGLCQDEITTNFVESFNALLGNDRCKPVLTLLEGLRRVTMVRHAKRQEIADTWDEDGICPKVAEHLSKLTKDSRTCRVYNGGRGRLEIQDGQSHLPVSLEDRTCGCGKWQISGLPCKHAIRAISHLNQSPTAYCHEWFSVRRYKLAYGRNIRPIGDQESWPQYNLPHIQPPPLKRSIGRPPRNRRREAGEPKKGKRSITVQCKKCKAYGHNKTSCKGGPTAREIKQQGVTVLHSQRKSKRKEAIVRPTLANANEPSLIYSSSQPGPSNATEPTPPYFSSQPLPVGKGNKRRKA